MLPFETGHSLPLYFYYQLLSQIHKRTKNQTPMFLLSRLNWMLTFFMLASDHFNPIFIFLFYFFFKFYFIFKLNITVLDLPNIKMKFYILILFLNWSIIDHNVICYMLQMDNIVIHNFKGYILFIVIIKYWLYSWCCSLYPCSLFYAQ